MDIPYPTIGMMGQQSKPLFLLYTVVNGWMSIPKLQLFLDVNNRVSAIHSRDGLARKRISVHFFVFFGEPHVDRAKLLDHSGPSSYRSQCN